MKKVFLNKFFWIGFVVLSILAFFTFYGAAIYLDLRGVDNNKNELRVDVVEDEHRSFILYYDSTNYQKSLFSDLKELDIYSVSEGEEVTDEKIQSYLEIYAKNYIADFITLNVKDPMLNRYGGEQFLIAGLRASYGEIDGISDYYFAKKYYILEHEDTYKEDLPEVSNLTLVETLPTTFDYYDAIGSNEDKEEMQGFVLTYEVEYKNKNASESGIKYYDQIEVTVVNWDGEWTVVELRTSDFEEVPTVINMY